MKYLYFDDKGNEALNSPNMIKRIKESVEYFFIYWVRGIINLILVNINICHIYLAHDLNNEFHVYHTLSLFIFSCIKEKK